MNCQLPPTPPSPPVVHRIPVESPSPGVYRLEVRCCCNPRLLLGHITVPRERAPRRGDQIRIALRDGHYNRSEVELSLELCQTSRAIEKLIQDPKCDIQEIEIERRLAIKSNDRPIEFFEKLPGFERAHQH